MLLFDATRPLQLDALYVQALELFLRRASLRVLTLPVELHASRLKTALGALEPSMIVLGGSAASLDVIARLVYAARQRVGGVDVVDYRGALPDTGASTVGRLGATPTAALEGVTKRLAARQEDARPRAALQTDTEETERRAERLALSSEGFRRRASGAAATVAVTVAVFTAHPTPAPQALSPADPLAHRALESLLRAEAALRRQLSADLRREGLSAPGFSLLVVLMTAGGELELRTLRRRFTSRSRTRPR